MPRWYLFLSAIVFPVVVFACNDETIQDVDPSVCLSGKQWIGGKRGDPRMYPGRDCVGCHLDNDGPELMFGGTVYSFVESDLKQLGMQPQTGGDCFGQPDQIVEITGGDGQVFTTTTNEAGNFFVEGKATDLVKPFEALLKWTAKDGSPKQNPMFTHPSYGGCGRCHTLGVEAIPRKGESRDDYSADEIVTPPGSHIGMPGYSVPPSQ